MVDVEKWLSYEGTCHVILLAKLHDMYIYKTDTFSTSTTKVSLEGGSLAQLSLYHLFTLWWRNSLSRTMVVV